MVARRKNGPEEEISTRQRPATTPEGRENQLISLAVDLAEKQMKDGSASAQVITHYLKLGSSREKLEQARLEQEVELMKIKAEAIESQQRVEELYINALNAMRTYSGSGPAEVIEGEYYED